MTLLKAEMCRGCGSRDLHLIHDFGEQPLAGHYPTKPESIAHSPRYRLDLSQCGYCSLLQVLHLPPIEAVFHGDYRYSSSTVPALVRHFTEYAAWLSERTDPGARVFEFGCNDGVLLAKLKERGLQCAGVDASDNVAELARQKGLDVTTGFLNIDFVRRAGLSHYFDLVTCSNVFAHIHEVRDTLQAVKALLKPGGLFSVEVHDGELLRSMHQFDTIYHEHLTYFTEKTLRALLERNGFEFLLCEHTPMHGGGLRCLVRHSESLADPLPTETGSPFDLTTDFIGPVIERCRAELRELFASHGPLDGYGAAGRSQMFVNFTATADLFRRAFDDSSLRQGRYIVGTDIPIQPYADDSGRCVVVLAWNYADDIARKVRGKYEKIVTLLPELKVW